MMVGPPSLSEENSEVTVFLFLGWSKTGGFIYDRRSD